MIFSSIAEKSGKIKPGDKQKSAILAIPTFPFEYHRRRGV
jgi:hypothetical protein